MSSTCSFIGVPFDGEATLGWPGARYAPEAIRRHLSWMEMRVQDGEVYWLDQDRVVELEADPLVDVGDASVVPHDTAATFSAVRLLAADEIRAGRKPIVVGGDDSILFPAVAAVHDAGEGSLAIIHFDAHLDLLDESPEQGRFSHSSGMRRALELEHVDPGASVQVGTRNLNYASSKRFIDEVGLLEIPATVVHNLATDALLEQLAEHTAGVDRTFLALDMDVLDPAHAPGVGWHEPGGLTSRQLLDLVVGLAPLVEGMCLNEVNPMTDVREQTVILAANVIFQFAVATAAK
ncbi:MAG: arginase family protein [Acidimicrobiia bacterium]